MIAGNQLGPFVLLFIALALAAFVVIVYLIYISRQRTKSASDLRKMDFRQRYLTAFWGSATVISAKRRDEPEPNEGNVLVDLQMEVETPEGNRYPVKTTWSVDSNFLHHLRPGETVSIKIDRLDGMRIYPNEDWAEPLE